MKKALLPCDVLGTQLSRAARLLYVQCHYVHDATSTRDASDRFGTLESMGIDMLTKNRRRPQWVVDKKRRDTAWHANAQQHTSDVYGSKLVRFERQMQMHKPTINEPVSWMKKKRDKLKKEHVARERYEQLYGKHDVNAKVIVDCARNEFNHFEGMRYASKNIPLVSEFWAKNKYKDDWFMITRTSKNPSFDVNRIKSWSDCVHLLHPSIAENVLATGFQQPTVIQRLSLNAFQGKDHLFIAAETGSGKTLAYAAPLLSQLLQAHQGGQPFKVVVVVLSNELRLQTRAIFDDLAKGTNIRICSEKREAKGDQEWDILIGTAGMVRDCLGSRDNSEVKCLALDEADMLLDDSFVGVMTDLLASISIRFSDLQNTQSGSSSDEGARVVFASATCPSELRELAQGVVDESHLQYVQTKGLHALMTHIEQMFLRVRERDKLDKLQHIITLQQNIPNAQTLVFCKDKKTMQFVSGSLTSRGMDNIKIGDMHKGDHNAMTQSSVLVATDRAARGLDLPKLSEVVNYDFPRHMVDYIHRAGRVGRVGSRLKCRVTSFVRSPWEVELVNTIETAARFNSPIKGVETNVAAKLRDRQDINTSDE